MWSNLIPFEEIIQGVKDDTGIENLRNLYPKIRRLVYRCEKDLGFGGTAVLKKVLFSVENELINTTGELWTIKIPEDLISIESVGSCKEGLCPNDYIIQGNILFLCKKIKEFSLVYYTLLCDGEGNPVITENHREAVISGVSYFLYKPYWRSGKGSERVFDRLERYYHDRLGEAKGDDVMPTTEKEWSKISSILHMSYRDIMIYDKVKGCVSCVPQGSVPQSTEVSSAVVYYWQFNNLSEDISFAPNINQNFLDLQDFASIQSFNNGYIVSYNKIGRIAFAIKNVSENQFKIYDIFGTEITTSVFDTFYDNTNNTQIYISKEYYSYGNIYFKII